jgi:hypothetical protein
MYLSRNDFKGFQELAGVDFQNLLSKYESAVRAAQRELCNKRCVLSAKSQRNSGLAAVILKKPWL